MKCELQSYVLGGDIMIIKEPTVGPIIGWTTTNSVRLWARGDESSKSRTFGVARIRKSGAEKFGKPKVFKMMPVFDFTGIVDFGALSTNQSYDYQVGYVFADGEPDELSINLKMIGVMSRTAPSGRRFQTPPTTHPLFLGHADICCDCSAGHSLMAAATRPSDQSTARSTPENPRICC